MKVIEPGITCLLISHMKPTLKESIQSVLAQSRKDFELIVVDSGQWIGSDIEQVMGDIYSQYSKHPKIEWLTTGESKDFVKMMCPVSYWTNKIINTGIRGKYFCTHYDDDIYYPDFFEKMAGYMDQNPECEAVRCSQKRNLLLKDGSLQPNGELPANNDIIGPNLDCRVDGQQIMLRTSLINKMVEKYGPELLPNDPNISSCSHSDGIFLNKVGETVDKVHFISDFLCEHRNTIYSTYTPIL